MFKASWAGAILASGLFALVLQGHFGFIANGFEAVAEFHAGPVAIHDLGSLFLAAHFHAAWEVAEHHGGGGFVDLLSPGTAATDELLLKILLTNAQFAQAFLQGFIIGQGHADKMQPFFPKESVRAGYFYALKQSIHPQNEEAHDLETLSQ